MKAKLWLLFGLTMAFAQQRQPYSTWSDYGGSADSMQYSALKQIDRTNVHRLEQVWFHAAPGRSGRRDVCGGEGDGAIVALGAATGKEIWSHRRTGRMQHDVRRRQDHML